LRKHTSFKQFAPLVLVYNYIREAVSRNFVSNPLFFFRKILLKFLWFNSAHGILQ